MKPIKFFRGAYANEKDRVLKALNNTRFSDENKIRVIDYLVNNKRISDMDCSKQQIFARVKKIVLKLEVRTVKKEERQRELEEFEKEFGGLTQD